NKNSVKGQFAIVNKKNIPKSWKIKLLGEHNLENISLAIETARKFGIKETVIKKVAESFNGLPGRLEFIREVSGVKYYNDTTATTPEATLAALNLFKNKKGKIILIGGGADKNLEYGGYARVVKKYVKALILFRGLASDKIISALGKTKISVEIADSMKKAMEIAKASVKKGDIVLLSPGAASFGVFKNEFDRGEQFNKIVKNLKKHK
ncbi:MAG: UDP-N-acetylmuramoyl-L-alanine--D-glutamate ligase, partial [Candidatus Yanofskybacteria bacterium CG10_big_fil_rev_8_21_14_0_10_37_15]